MFVMLLAWRSIARVGRIVGSCMRIAFDLDGVLADLHQPFVKAALRLFPELDASSIGAPDVGASPPDEEAPRQPEPAEPRVALSNRQAEAVGSISGRFRQFWEGLPKSKLERSRSWPGSPTSGAGK